ncbi:hypothetical protein HXX76_015910 [Chlamydomonas incerta]|uniref:B30.2/SPRY domain-containing protein n=1 Tax=Chlamydomonas incerta TaxID=51695 RepID=A0A835SD92_CHLIN|nr:hypothetical protein HXX76_015910 [Chlamydomonas incerta]|eukprot:KAG2422582.1 hypothetical protein HXX76_015910 [Chlamydomonas incerta]
MAGTSGGYYNSRCSLPSAWETRVAGIRNQSAMQYLKVDGTRVRYVGPGEDDTQAATIRSNYPLPADVPLFYFEITVLDRGQDGFIGVGLCTDTVLLTRLPGWDPHSYGYHGDDGNAFAGSGTGRPYGPGYGAGDVIGVLYDRSNRSISYFKNGLPLGPAFRDVAESAPLYPCVGLRTRGEEVMANFGGAGPLAEPFRTDLAALRTAFQRSVLSAIRNTKLPLLAAPAPAPPAAPTSAAAAAASPSPLASSAPAAAAAAAATAAAADPSGSSTTATAAAASLGAGSSTVTAGGSSRPLLPHLLYDYLVHQRYAGTAAVVARDMLRGQPALGEAELSDMRLRGAVSEAVAGGDVDGALAMLQGHAQYAQVLADRPSLDFRLRLQRFVEMVGAATSAAAAGAGGAAAAGGPNGNGAGSGSAPAATEAPIVSSASAAAAPAANGAGSAAAARNGGVASTSGPGPAASGEGAGAVGAVPTTRDILAYGTQELWGRCRTAADRDLLTDALSLLAFHDPAASPAGYLLRPAHRAALAEELNGALLAAAGRPPHSSLERLFQQAACCVAELKRADHPQALALPDPRVLVLEPPPALSAALASPPGDATVDVGAGGAGGSGAAGASSTDSMSM